MTGPRTTDTDIEVSDLLDIEDDESGGPSAPLWMVTYSDMVTLLLTFFVMIVSMSEVEVKKFKAAMSYFQGRTAMLTHDTVRPTPAQQLVTEDFQSREQAERYETLLEYLEENGLQDKVQVDLTDKGLHIVISDSVMFDTGEAELIEPSRTILRLVAGMVDEKVEAIVVEGHTDNRPIHTGRYPSNWELSTARAASVVRFLLEQENTRGPPRYVAIGYGEYHPVETNETPEGRAANRRVEILFSWEPWQNEINPYLKRIQPPNL